jgi:hypothetical protein
MDTEKKKRGRPVLPDCQKQKLRQVRMTDSEYADIVEKARKLGVSFSEYMRNKAFREG